MIALHHVQVACPPGGEDAARRFYADGARADRGREARRPGRPRRRLVPRVRRAAARSARSSTSASRTRSCRPARPTRPSSWTTSTPSPAPCPPPAFDVDDRERDTFAGYLRFHAHDPHGNRVEVLQVRPADAS